MKVYVIFRWEEFFRRWLVTKVVDTEEKAKEIRIKGGVSKYRYETHVLE